MNSQALFLFAVVALAVLQTRGRVKADAPGAEKAEIQWGETVNGLRAHIETSDDAATRPYHPGEPLQFAGCIQNVSAKSVQIIGEYVEFRAHTLLYVRVPDGKVFVRRPHGIPDRIQPGQILPNGPKFTCRFDGRIDARLKGWFDPHTLQSETKMSLHQPGTYRFWFEYNIPSGNQASWSGKLESNHITLTVTDLPPAQRLQKPTAAQIDELRMYLGPFNGIRPRHGTAELEKAINGTENEGLALYLVEQLDRNPENMEAILHLLARRADGIDGPYLHQLAIWCVESLEHGKLLPDDSFEGFYPTLIYAPLAYLDFHPEDAKLRGRIVAVAEQSADIYRLLRGGKHQPAPEIFFKPIRQGGPLFLGIDFALEVLLDQKALHGDGMSIAEVTAILGEPIQQGPTRITWVLPNGGVSQRWLSADVKDGKLINFDWN